MERELHFNVLFACIFEWNSEFLLSWDVLDCERNVSIFHLTFELGYFWFDHLHADHLGNLNLTSKENVKLLHLCDFLPVFEEVFHAAFEFVLQEILEAFLYSEFLVCIGKQADIDH